MGNRDGSTQTGGLTGLPITFVISNGNLFGSHSCSCPCPQHSYQQARL